MKVAMPLVEWGRHEGSREEIAQFSGDRAASVRAPQQPRPIPTIGTHSHCALDSSGVIHEKMPGSGVRNSAPNRSTP